MKVYRAIASKLGAMNNCKQANNLMWYDRHMNDISDICKNQMPSGSGFDCGTKLDFDKSTPEKLVFLSSYHHMNETGYYDGWSELTITVTPSLQFGYNIRITGLRRKNRDDMEYMTDTFSSCLDTEIGNV